MATDKKSFILHIDSLDVLDDLSDQQTGQLFKAIRDYQNGNEVKLDGLMNAVFKTFKNQFLRDANKYDSVVTRNRLNGSKGGRPKITQPNPNNPVGLSVTQTKPTEPKKADSDSDSGSDNDSKKDNVNDKEKESKGKTARFVPPTKSEIWSYMTQEKGKDRSFALKESEKMFNFYESKGWLVGKAKMKNWKAAASNWITRAETDFASKEKPAFKLKTNRPT
jgi:hypothetical protein